ncbi:hypothetical protein GCM10027589_29650 [Actinocorallia lasiicapitis]
MPVVRGPSPVVAEAEVRVREIARAPIAGRLGNVAVWTGREMVVWGGFSGPRKLEVDGAAYDPALDRWRTLPGAPLAARIQTSAVWTGRTLFVWGGIGIGGRPAFADGAELDPAAGTWTMLPASPLSGRRGAAAVWTGREVVLWGGLPQRGGPAAGAGAAYDPLSRTWRRLPDFPIAGALPRHAVWTGGELIATAERRGKVLAASYDPVRNVWRRLPDPPVSAFGHTSAVWADGRAVLFPDTHLPDRRTSADPPPGAAYAPATGTWRPVAFPRSIPPMSPALATGKGVVVWSGYTIAAVYRPSQNRWEKVEVPPVEGYREQAAAVRTGSEVILWGGDTCPPTADCLAVRPQERGVALRVW